MMSNQSEVDLLEKYFTEGGGGKSANFLVKGVLLKGVLMEPPTEKVQTDLDGNEKTFADGKKRTQLVLKLQTEERDPEDENDTGVRWLYTKHQMILAIRESLKEQGLKTLAVGGTLEIAWTGDQKAAKAGYHPTKLFQARWTPPPLSFMADEKPEGKFNFDSAPVNTNSAATSPLDALKGMQGKPAQNEEPPF
jgi:hypothetical protein